MVTYRRKYQETPLRQTKEAPNGVPKLKIQEQKGAFPRPKVVRAVVPAAVAQKRLADTAIEMLRTMPFDKVTAREVTKRAGLAQPTIARNFGSMEGLFVHITSVLLDNAIARIPKIMDQTLFLDRDFVLRTQLISWLISEGSSPKIFHANIIQENVRAFANEAGGICDRTSFTWLTLVTVIAEGYAVFAGMHELTSNQLADALTLLAAMRDKLPALERELGWTQ